MVSDIFKGEKMKFDIFAVTGLGNFSIENYEDGQIFKRETEEGEKAFLVEHLIGGDMEKVKTVEVRCDRNLSRVLQEKYESVMESRYFGRGGVEIVLSGQMELDEVYDLVRLSYNLTIG